jgi:catechol 2,3-dioxygenase
MIGSEEKNEAKPVIHPDARLGYVHLTVSDLERSLAFYQDMLGFRLHQREGDKACLGAGRDDLLALTERPGAIRVPRQSGLYHFAILVPSRLALAQSLRRLIETETNLAGGADHLVSEALYLSDPDGNGIEIYRDLPRSAWEYENGMLRMGTEALDYQGILAELENDASPWTGLRPDTTLGHLHLHVAHLSEAQAFYEKVLGLDTMVVIPGSAAFLSAGGYHHHVGINTWNGVGAPSPPPDAVGLRYFTVQLPNEEEQARLIARLEKAGVPFETREDGLFVWDPSQNGLAFTVRETKNEL